MSSHPVPPALEGPPIVFMAVYRRANAEFIRLLLTRCPRGVDVRLWALDQIDPSLADRTLGVGPGSRFQNLNRLLSARRATAQTWAVIADDDVLVTRGTVGEMIQRMIDARLDIAQPGHSLLSWWSSPFTVARPFLNARATHYVEQGPLVVLSPAAMNRVFPLPESDDMAWGIEVEWNALEREGIRLGIVDETRMIHFFKNASTYDIGPEMARLSERLSAAGFRSIWDLQRSHWHWWSHQRLPPSTV